MSPKRLAWSEAPAATLRQFRKAASEEVNAGLSIQRQGTNECRDAHNFVSRWGLTWKVPLSYMDYSDNGQPCKYAYIRPLNFIEVLIKKAPELLVGGCPNMDVGRSHLESFWKAYKGIHPNHCLFMEEHSQRSMNNTFCLALHGDEGRGLKKGNTTILTMESCIGVDTYNNMRVGKCATTCSDCIGNSPAAKRIRLNRGDAARVLQHDPAAFQATNLKQHSFLTKFVLAALPRKETDLINAIMGEKSRETSSNFFEKGSRFLDSGGLLDVSG